jgi:hypothetical protein
VRVADDRLCVGDRFSMSLQRTLRIPDDGREYPLPPGLGRFPLRHLDGSKDSYLIPMYQREALWLGFDAAAWKPNAVQVSIGRINALSGLEWTDGLRADPPDYMVCPPQLWLDGINAGIASVRQFVAMPLGSGATVEGQLTGTEKFGGIQVCIYEPLPGRFPDRPPPAQPGLEAAFVPSMPTMGIAAGGVVRQKIYPDPHGLDTWDPRSVERIYIHILNSEQYEQVVGSPPPPSPINAETYTEWGLPWFDLYDDDLGDVAPPDLLKRLRSIDDLHSPSIEVPEDQIQKLTRRPNTR